MFAHYCWGLIPGFLSGLLCICSHFFSFNVWHWGKVLKLTTVLSLKEKNKLVTSKTNLLLQQNLHFANPFFQHLSPLYIPRVDATNRCLTKDATSSNSDLLIKISLSLQGEGVLSLFLSYTIDDYSMAKSIFSRLRRKISYFQIGYAFLK